MASAPPKPTRNLHVGELGDDGLAQRIAMFAVVTGHARAATVIDGLSKDCAAAAKKLFAEISTWPSGKRQGRVSLEFGQRADHLERLGRAMAAAHPALRLAMFAQMTPQQQARYPRLAHVEFRQVPGRNTFAARLVREASR
ncbi:MAG: hypothetical protein JNK82_21760 [Myxococcaceae bacterium]|nr:hypothetical protein [Myxococcaceae bacterium]